MRWYGRLRRSGEIAFVRRRGLRVGLGTCTAFAVAGDGQTRVCITVAKSVGGAVVRNAVRRRIAGALDAHGHISDGRRLVFVATPGAATAPYASIAADVARVLARRPNASR
jgi:ribonuclease P protein component